MRTFSSGLSLESHVVRFFFAISVWALFKGHALANDLPSIFSEMI